MPRRPTLLLFFSKLGCACDGFERGCRTHLAALPPIAVTHHRRVAPFTTSELLQVLSGVSDARLAGSLGFIVPSTTSVMAPVVVPSAHPDNFAPRAAAPPGSDPAAAPSLPTAGSPLPRSTPSGSRSSAAVEAAQPPLADLRVTHFSLPSTTRSSTSDTRHPPGLPFALSEALLVRDMLYVFQGIDGTYIRYFDSPPSNSGSSSSGSGSAPAAVHTGHGPRPSPSPLGGFRVIDSAAAGVPQSTRQLVCRLGELGWLYRRVTAFLEAQSVAEALGCVAQVTRSRAALFSNWFCHPTSIH